jgi:hypothetical protein
MEFHTGESVGVSLRPVNKLPRDPALSRNNRPGRSTLIFSEARPLPSPMHPVIYCDSSITLALLISTNDDHFFRSIRLTTTLFSPKAGVLLLLLCPCRRMPCGHLASFVLWLVCGICGWEFCVEGLSALNLSWSRADTHCQYQDAQRRYRQGQ